MEGLLLGAVLGLGALLIFDGLTRPDGKLDILKRLVRLGPKGAGALAGGSIGFLFTGWGAATVAGAVLGASVPVALSRVRSETRRLEKTEAIADLSARLRDALRSGIGIQDALTQAARNAPPILASDLNRLVADAKVSGLSVAANSLAHRLDDPAGDLLASALGLAERLGARQTSELLDSLAESATARAAVIREARARQARNRSSARIVAAAPMILLLAIRRANPAFLEPFDTISGQFVLALTFAMIAAGYLLMIRMARIEGASR